MATTLMTSVSCIAAFHPAKFFGEADWAIDEQDERLLELTQVDLSKISLHTMLENDEHCVNGEEKLKRLKKAGHTPLDAAVFQTLWENQHLIPANWKEKTSGDTTYVSFDGTVLRDPNGERCVLCLYWRGGKWGWNHGWLVSDWFSTEPSAVLANSTGTRTVRRHHF